MNASLRPTEQGPTEDEVRKASPLAGNLLRSGRATAAFIAPPWCDASGGERSDMRQRACLALVGDLERKAAVAGYRIVDRRRLQPNLYEAAAREGVDVLFIIDELSVRTAATEQLDVSRFDFSEQTSASTRSPVNLQNPSIVNARCEAALKARKRRTTIQDDVTGIAMSVKMVSVSDGAAAWFYRRGVRDEGAGEIDSNAFYYLSEGTKKTKPKKLVGGILSLSIGIATVASGTYMNQNGTSFVSRNLGAGLAWASIIPLTVGAILSTVGIVAQAKPPVYQSADEVLCAKPPYTENPFGGGSASADQSALSGPPAPIGPSQRGDTEVTARLVDDFFSALNTLSRDRTSSPMPTTATRVPEPEIASPAARTTTPAEPPHIDMPRVEMPRVEPTPVEPRRARIAPKPEPTPKDESPPASPSPKATLTTPEPPQTLILRKTPKSDSRGTGGRHD